MLTEPILGALAAAMASSTAVLVRWGAEARTPFRASAVVFLLLMMAGMFAGALVYYLVPGPTGLVEGLWVASALMSASVGVVLFGFLREAQDRSGPTGPSRGAGPFRGFVATVVGLVFLNELLMGWTFGLASGTLGPTLGGGLPGALSLLASVAVSPWFVLTMAAEMALASVLLRARLPRSALGLLLGQASIMALAPPTLADPLWVSGSIALSSAVMIAVVILVLEHLYRHRTIPGGLASYLVRLLAVYAVMMAGVFSWQLSGSVDLFAVAVVLEMVVFFDAVLRPERLATGAPFRWLEHPGWAVQLLAWVFVTELFMGASLNAGLLPGGTVFRTPFLPLSGSLATALEHAVSNGFYFVANTTSTTAFLAMMGLEMGALAFWKLREATSRELRIRMGLMLASYAAFVVFYPSLYYGRLFPGAPGATASAAVPLLGWSMGLGSAPLAPGVLGIVAVTYVAFAVVVLLFGRRAICSVFCSAAVMYQGTTIDAMKDYRRTSPLARRYLGSRLSSAYQATTVGIVAALGGTSILSYLDAVGRANLTVGGLDPSVFLFALSFGVLWYVFFVTLPYAGTYSCASLGWCYTGQIAGLFSRAGFFRLRVRDREICRQCTTFDCAKACPVGLVDMPAGFRAKGEFRSAKCCGVGGCASACPYGNLFLADVRHWLRGRRAPSPTSHPGVPLPMAGASSPTPRVVTTPAPRR